MKAARLLRIDGLRTVRDPMLFGLALLPPALALALRLGADTMRAAAPYPGAEAVALVVLLLTTPLMFGFAAGLMLLDERDEGVLTAVALTPAGRAGFLAFRVAVPVAATALLTFIALPLAGLMTIPLARLAVLALLAGIQAALLPAFLGAFAGNKVEGIALGKVATVIVALGALAVLMPDRLKWLAWWSPHYWIVALALAETAARAALTGGMALLVHAFALAALVGRLQRRTGG
jgi:fluoroquinolone transport system permease protein